MFVRIREEDRGAALVVAVGVAFVVLLISLMVVQLSLHSSTQSAYDRKRVQAIAAAESGIDAFWNMVQHTPPEELPCNVPTPGRLEPMTGPVDVSPGIAAYKVEAVYYDVNANEIACTALGQEFPLVVPAAVVATSTGTASGTVARKMQTYMKLTSIQGSGFDAAIISENGTAIRNKITIVSLDPNAGDIYVNNGSLEIANSLTVNGNVYVSNGAACIANGTVITGDLSAWGNVSLKNPAAVTGSVRSSSSSITPSDSTVWTGTSPCRSGTSGGRVGRDATAAFIDSRVSVAGERYISTTSEHPQSQALPILCWSAIRDDCKSMESDWTNPPTTDPPTQPYQIREFTGSSACDAAAAFLRTGVYNGESLGYPISGNTVVRIEDPCELKIGNMGNNEAIRFDGNLAIYTDGKITMENQNNWEGIGGARNLYFIVGYQPSMVANLAQACGTHQYDITTSNYSHFGGATVAMYSPCYIYIYNNNANGISGQILGGWVIPRNNFSLEYVPVPIPGAEIVLGFQQDVVYLREVA